MFENKTEKEIAMMLQEDPALLQKVKDVKEMLDLFDEMTQEQKLTLIDQLRPVYPTIADAFIQIMGMNGSDPETLPGPVASRKVCE